MHQLYIQALVTNPLSMVTWSLISWSPNPLIAHLGVVVSICLFVVCICFDRCSRGGGCGCGIVGSDYSEGHIGCEGHGGHGEWCGGRSGELGCCVKLWKCCANICGKFGKCCVDSYQNILLCSGKDQRLLCGVGLCWGQWETSLWTCGFCMSLWGTQGRWGTCCVTCVVVEDTSIVWVVRTPWTVSGVRNLWSSGCGGYGRQPVPGGLCCWLLIGPGDLGLQSSWDLVQGSMVSVSSLYLGLINPWSPLVLSLALAV